MPSLAGTFLGSVTADFGTSAPLRIQFSGAPDATVAFTSLGPGAHIDCNGNNKINPVEFKLSGTQTTVNADGSSAFELTGRFEFDTDSPIGSVHVVVDLAVHGVLSRDGRSFSGPLDLQVKPSHGDDCTRHWSVSTTTTTSAIFSYNDQTGETQIWFMAEEQLVRRASVLGEDGQPAFIGPPFRIVGVSDMDGDGRADIVWHHDQTGETQIWFMAEEQLVRRATVLGEDGQPAFTSPPFRIVGTSSTIG